MVLNPSLYSLLRSRFGAIKVINEGQRTAGSYRTNPINGRLVYKARQRGESYRINCPFCNDTRFRLYVSHRWGLWDENLKSYNYHLAYCFNEDCIRLIESAKDRLVDMIIGHINRNQKRTISNLPVDRPTTVNVKAELPGVVIPLTELPNNHSAIVYLRERDFDTVEISEAFGVGYCPNAKGKFVMASNRIIIPLYMDDELKGWQARYIGDKDWKTARTAKYITMTGMRKTEFLYNYDNAKEADFVVVVEGPTDCWSVGHSSCVALFGKSASEKQKRLLFENWQNAVIMLDPDAEKESISLANDLKRMGMKVTRITLPADPGDLSNDYLWNVIYDSIQE